MSPPPGYREVYRNGQLFGSRAGNIAGRVLRSLAVVIICAFFVAYGVHQIRSGRIGRDSGSLITLAITAIAALMIPGWIAYERSALRRLAAARQFVAAGGRLACAEGFPRWKLDRTNTSGHASIRSGRSTDNVTGGSFAVGDVSWDLDEIADWRRLYEATGRPGSAVALNMPGLYLGGRGGESDTVVVRAWYVPDNKVLVGVEARPATPYDR